MKLDKTFLIAVMLFILMSCSSIFALTIETQFIGGAAPRNAVGGGNLTDLVNAAARIWESSYSDPSVLTIYYGWGSSTSEAATHTLLTQGGNPNRESAGMILFDNSGNTVFFLDPTPYLNEEYQGKTEEYQTFGGKEINVARLFKSPAIEAAKNVDLLSAALHEIGHALGMSPSNRSFASQCANGILTLSEGSEFAGNVIPLGHNYSGVIAHFDATEVAYGSLMSGINAGERRLPSELDIAANSQLSGFSVISYASQQPLILAKLSGPANGKMIIESTASTGGINARVKSASQIKSLWAPLSATSKKGN